MLEMCETKMKGNELDYDSVKCVRVGWENKKC